MWSLTELGGCLQVLENRLRDVGQQLMEVRQNLLGLLMLLLLLRLLLLLLLMVDVVVLLLLLLLLLDDGSDIW